MLRHVLDHARTRVVASLAIAAATVATVTGAAFAFTADGEATEVTAAGADIRAADPPSAAELVRRDSFQEAIERRGARARAAQVADGIAGARHAKADRYAVQPQPEPPAPAANHAAGGTVWDRLAQCESGGNWAASVGLYEGGLQFHPSTWDANKPSGYPDAAYQASRAQQIRVAEVVLASQGWGAWPACASELGLR